MESGWGRPSETNRDRPLETDLQTEEPARSRAGDRTSAEARSGDRSRSFVRPSAEEMRLTYHTG
eukprot:3103023-Lingulodinium_polyedra.AAC.1